MHFGSNFVYVHDPPAAEPNNVDAQTNCNAPSTSNPTQQCATSSDGWVDPNVLAVKFDVLEQPAHFHTGDPIRCSNADCNAVLSHLSHITCAPDKDSRFKVRLGFLVSLVSSL